MQREFLVQVQRLLSRQLPLPSCRFASSHTPPFVATRHLPPERGKSFLSGGAFRHLPVSRAKPPPFGGGGFAKQRRRGFSPLNSPSHHCGSAFLLAQACRDAPLGQRQGGVFRLPPPYLWTPPTPQRVKGCSPLTNLKKKSKHKKASAAPVGAIALTLFSLLHL